MSYQLISAPLDAQDEPRAVNIKRAYLYAKITDKDIIKDYKDPGDALLRNINGKAGLIRFPIPSWLTPKPNTSDLDLITPQNYTDFLNNNGCHDYSLKLKGFIESSILPSFPVTIGVDHSLTGGIVRALTRMVGSENLTVIILDSHFDAITEDIRKDSKNNDEPEGNTEIYNCGNFLGYLIKEKIILPNTLIIIGTSDCPSKSKGTFTEERGNFFKYYHSFSKMGVHILHRDDCQNVIRLNQLLDSINTPYIYLSIDIDVGANNSSLAVRLPDTIGLDKREILSIIVEIKRRIKRGQFALIGLDLMEINVHLLGITLGNGKKDQTIELGRNILKTLI